MGGGASGKGTSQATTQQTATNQQTAADSGIALGAGSHGNTVSVTTSDPETVKNSLLASAAAENSALNFAGHAGDVAASVNEFSISALRDTANMSVAAQNDLATKFISGVGDVAAQNVNLLQSLSDNQTGVTLQAQKASQAALDASFAVSKSVAPQDPSFALENVVGGLSKTALYIVLGVAALFIGFFALKGKKA